MIEKGKVTKINKNLAFVRIEKNAQCQGCKMCNFGDKQELILPALMQTECKVNDTVVVQMPQKQYILAPLFMFFIPLALFLIGLLVGRFAGGELLMVVFAFVFCAVGILIAYFADKSVRTSAQYAAIITDKILDK